MKGQIRVEFILGIVIFIIVIFLVVTQTNTLYSSLLSDSRKDALKAKAINVIDILVEDTGDPPNWDMQEVPVDVVLINDVSASMDGKANVWPYNHWGQYCRVPCDQFDSGGQAGPSHPACGSNCNNGCNETTNNIQADNASIDWGQPGDPNYVPPSQREVWPNCADCNGNGDRSDPNETDSNGNACPLTGAKSADDTFVDQLNSSIDRAAVVTFDYYARNLLSLTNDTNAIKTAIDNIYDYEGDTEIGGGIGNATKEFVNNGNTSSKWVEILMTDGRDSVYNSHFVDKALSAYSNYGIIFYTIGYGTKAYLNETALKEVADYTGGEYYYTPNSSTLEEAYIEIAQKIKANVTRVGLAVYKPYNPYNISQSKVSRLYSNCDFLDNFDLGAYRLKIYNSTRNQILFCGYDSLEPPTVMETRYVYIRGDFGKVTLELW